MLTVSFRIWTWVNDPISDGDNRFAESVTVSRKFSWTDGSLLYQSSLDLFEKFVEIYGGRDGSGKDGSILCLNLSIQVRTHKTSIGVRSIVASQHFWNAHACAVCRETNLRHRPLRRRWHQIWFYDNSGFKWGNRPFFYEDRIKCVKWSYCR